MAADKIPLRHFFHNFIYNASLESQTCSFRISSRIAARREIPDVTAESERCVLCFRHASHGVDHNVFRRFTSISFRTCQLIHGCPAAVNIAGFQILTNNTAYLAKERYCCWGNCCPTVYNIPIRDAAIPPPFIVALTSVPSTVQYCTVVQWIKPAIPPALRPLTEPPVTCIF